MAHTIGLLDAGNTIPFIARYRKEITGSLDENQILEIQNRITYSRHLDERKHTVLKSIEEQGRLTSELREKIESAEKLQDVEDLYLPYKPKRRTRASIAREKGLEPLALLMMAQEFTQGDILEIAGRYVDEARNVGSPEDALSGARDIIAETVAENAEIRRLVREEMLRSGTINSEGISEESAKQYEIYLQYSEPVRTVPPHRILAINRGEREGMLRVWIDSPEELLISSISKKIITVPHSLFQEQLELSVTDGYHRLIAPSMQREIRNMMTDRADKQAIFIFSENLRSLLMAPPIRGKMICGIDPGYRTGCKVAVIDQTGKYLHGETIYPHPPRNEIMESKKTLRRLIETYKIDMIAIGNGTASRETEQIVADLNRELDQPCLYTLVSEAGASVYSASHVAQQEFPDLEASLRGNISIARRLLDPLSELVKIDPKSIGVGQYQHDVDQGTLSDSLDHVVESCVNAVGVDLNTASASLLRYVAGIHSRVAENIVQFRESKGRFSNREELKQVGGLGENCFMQAAGFLRIPDSDVFFDSTAVHPESYASAFMLLDHFQIRIPELKTDGRLLNQKIKAACMPLDTLARICQCGEETLKDIIASLEKPNRDPRDEMPKPLLRQDVLSISDLRENMRLKGTIRNVVDFGAFVDIGVKQDGLVHISQMAKRYIKHPLVIVKTGDIVDVKVISVDIPRNRIALSMLPEDEPGPSRA